jgi:hypothetical protein
VRVSTSPCTAKPCTDKIRMQTRFMPPGQADRGLIADLLTWSRVA